MMDEVVICKYCKKPEYYGKMRWLNGREECRSCYKAHWQSVHSRLYTWDDLDGPRPSREEVLQHDGCETTTR